MDCIATVQKTRSGYTHTDSNAGLNVAIQHGALDCHGWTLKLLMALRLAHVGCCHSLWGYRCLTSSEKQREGKRMEFQVLGISWTDVIKLLSMELHGGKKQVGCKTWSASILILGELHHQMWMTHPLHCAIQELLCTPLWWLSGRLWAKAKIDCERDVAKALWKCTAFKGTASVPSGLDVGGKTSHVSAYVQIE